MRLKSTLFLRGPAWAHDWLIGRPELLKMAEAFEVIDALPADVKPAYGVERSDRRLLRSANSPGPTERSVAIEHAP
jgi:hypothetical protein